MTKTYFLPPTRETPPSGPIRLGALISTLSSPEIPLSATPLPIPPSLLSPPTIQSNYRLELSRQTGGKFGIWARFLQSVLGVGADLSVKHDNQTLDVFQFEQLETHTFSPSKEYVLDSMSDASVQAYLQRTRFRRNIYIITSIRIAKGARVASEFCRRKGVCLQLGLNGTTLGAPCLNAGPDMQASKGKEQKVAWEKSSDFVFAFRVREIFYTRGCKKGEEVVGQREYVKGALLGLEEQQNIEVDEFGGDPPLAKTETEKKFIFTFLGVGGKDISATDLDLHPLETIDNDNDNNDNNKAKCECVNLQHFKED